MSITPVALRELFEGRSMHEPRDLRLLFHRLNNQLGIVLAHAELLEAKARDEVSRSRASQVLASVLEAMATAKELRLRLGPAVEPNGVEPPEGAAEEDL